MASPPIFFDIHPIDLFRQLNDFVFKLQLYLLFSDDALQFGYLCFKGSQLSRITLGFYDGTHALFIVLTVCSHPFTDTVCPHFILAGDLGDGSQLLLDLLYFFSFEFFGKDMSLTLLSALFELFS